MNTMSRLLACALLIPTLGMSQESVTRKNISEGNVFKKEATKERQGKLIFDQLFYEDNIYSRSKKTEMGDQVELDLALRYQYSDDSFARIRFETDPMKNREDNKTSSFEALLHHKYLGVRFQLDLKLLTNDGSTGGTSLGLDLDSDDTFVKYTFAKRLTLSFYPFNFKSDVGDDFNSDDVTEIHFIEGSPSTVGSTPAGSEKIVSKTIPGIELAYSMSDQFLSSLYVGIGVASYLYPGNSDFNIETNPSADRWERREAMAHKFGYVYYDKDDARLSLQYVGQNKSEQTGALIEAAASGSGFYRVGKTLLKAEITWSKAGKRPYNLSRTTSWFSSTTPFLPIYSDIFGNRQSWVGKSDYAAGFKLGHEIGNASPYVAYKYQGKNFIFREDESAHLLRTADEASSHGGLNRLAFGSTFFIGKYFVKPEIEYRRAKNAVFSNSSDVRSDRILSSFKKSDILMSIFVTYSFDENNLLEGWWF